MLRIFLLSMTVLALVLLTGCSSSTNTFNGSNNSTYDVDLLGVPVLVNTNYIELDSIGQISRFRSGVGHDYSDSFEHARSMKHYFAPKAPTPGCPTPGQSTSWEPNIYSPVDGKISRFIEEWAGTQIHIRADDNTAFDFIIFHVIMNTAYHTGDKVIAGQLLGKHIGRQTSSDIAVGVDTPQGYRLVSYFDTMSDALFQSYQAHGIGSRSELIISKAERDADPLQINGEVFTTQSSLPDWVTLQ